MMFYKEIMEGPGLPVYEVEELTLDQALQMLASNQRYAERATIELADERRQRKEFKSSVAVRVGV